MKHAKRLVVLFAAVITMTTLSAKAFIPDIEDWLCNFYVWNHSGQTANDFEVYVGGITTNDIADNGIWNYDYPNYSVTPVGNGVEIYYTGSSTPDGGSAHFGVSLKSSVIPSSVVLYWTYNGTRIETVPFVQNDSGTYFSTLLCRDIPVDIVSNPGPNAVWISVGVVAAPGNVDLTNLVVGGPLWSSATFGPTNYLAAGSSLTNIFDGLTNDIVYHAGLIIKQFSNNGGLIGQEQVVNFAFVNVNYDKGIPTLPQWGLIIMGLVLLATGTFFILRKRAVTAPV